MTRFFGTLSDISRYFMQNTQPLYIQIALDLEQEIRRDYVSGAALASEVQLAQRFDVNRHTIRKSIDKLVMKGLVVRKRGIGLFVAGSTAINYALNSTSRVSGNLQSIGIEGDLKIICRRLEVASMNDANWLKCSPGEPLLMVETLRYADGVPFGLIQHKFVYSKFPLIYQNYDSGSLHDFINKFYAIRLVRTKVVIKSILSDDSNHESKALKIEAGRPLIQLSSLNVCSKNNVPVEYSSAKLRGDIVELKSVY